MTIRQVYKVENNQLIIQLPDSFKGKSKLMVTVDDSVDTKVEKLNLLKNAASDPLFLSDILEISDDFSHIDSEKI
jgi:molybdopterin biosynthesis enzyme MoaB